MHLDKALEQISEIHAQVLKAEVFRGYRPTTMLTTAACAVLAAALQPSLLAGASAAGFVGYWVAVAGLCAAICAVDICRSTLRNGSETARWKTVLVVLQSVPALLVGAVVTGILVQRDTQIGLLPGLWAIFFALGIWSSRPYLPRAVGVVALFYFLAGTWQMVFTGGSGAGTAVALPPSPWGMGLTFGLGQVALAAVLYINLERPMRFPNEGVRRRR